ncbi:MAG: hydrogenase maturation nickel metallochaperone HypA [Candidatus Acidiferrales bacterium]
MHELSIAMSIVDLACKEAESHGAPGVDVVYLKLGPLSGVVKEALLFSYQIACEQTPLEGSTLRIEEVPIVVNCPVCMDRRSVQSLQSLCCAECGTPTPEILEGRELLVTAMELRQ